MNLQPLTIRERLQNYEFTDEQEMNLTLELLNRVEKDIDEQRARKTRDGLSEYVALASFAGVLYLLLGELNKLADLSSPAIAVPLFSGLLLLKIPWAFYQLVAIDQATKRRHEPGRFFWSNDLLFENRLGGLFQLLVFLACGTFVFFLSLPLWISISTGMAFLLYALILGLVFVLSFKREPISPNNTNKWTMVGLPVLFLAATIMSVTGLFSQMNTPIGKEASSYVIAGLLLALIFFVDRLIRLATPSLLLEKLERLRYDIIFLKADLRDAWIRYEIIVYGHDISEELKTEIEDIIRAFNTLDYGQTQQEKSLSAIQDELTRLDKEQQSRRLIENDLATVNSHKVEFFAHLGAVTRLYTALQPRIDKLAKEVNKISRTTQEWERADEYHKFILSRLEALDEMDKQIAKKGAEAEAKINRLFPKTTEQHQGS